MGLDPIEDRDVKIERVQKRPQIKEDATVQRAENQHKCLCR